MIAGKPNPLDVLVSRVRLILGNQCWLQIDSAFIDSDGMPDKVCGPFNWYRLRGLSLQVSNRIDAVSYVKKEHLHDCQHWLPVLINIRVLLTECGAERDDLIASRFTCTRMFYELVTILTIKHRVMRNVRIDG